MTIILISPRPELFKVVVNLLIPDQAGDIVLPSEVLAELYNSLQGGGYIMVASFLAKIWPPVRSFCRILVNIVTICPQPVPVSIVIVHRYSGLNVGPVWYQLIV